MLMLRQQEGHPACKIKRPAAAILKSSLN